MTLSPLAYADSLRIGTIDYVSPDGIKVLLDIEAPDGVALNTGAPRPFPRVNGYVLAPSDQGYLVAQVEWITIERSQYPKRKGMQDFGLVDLPYPLRKMSLNPLGCLFYTEGKYEFRRGVEAYPSVGDPVILPTQKQLRAIVESGEKRRIKIGISPLAANAAVKVDPDRIFGRHLAVLGNTGSGKSCSVAGLIRWSMDAARKARTVTAHGKTIPVAAARSFPEWLRTGYPDLEAPYPRIAVSLGGARRHVIRSMGVLKSTGFGGGSPTLGSFQTKGI